MDAEQDSVRVRPFAAYLTETNKGRTHAELSEGLHDLTAEVLRTGKKGSIQLTITVEPDDVESRRLTVSELVAVKMPRPTARKSIFWSDDDGSLVRSDPMQMSLGDIQAVPTTTAERKIS